MKNLAVSFVVAISMLTSLPTEAATKSRSKSGKSATSCPCSGSKLCVGPRGGKYCHTATGKKKYQR